MPSMTNSASARRARASAWVRSLPVTISLANIESKEPPMTSPDSTPESSRTPGPDGGRLDSGVESGDVIGGSFDSMLAKLIVTGKDRTQALARARRALAEFVIEGMPTVLPFHQAVVADEAFAPKNPAQPFTVHTRWIETELVNEIPAYAGVVALAPEDTGERQSVVGEVGGT